VTAHFHLVVWHEKPEREVLIGVIGWKHEAGLVPESPGDVLHIGGAHTPRVSDNRAGVAAAAVNREYTEHLYVDHHFSFHLGMAAYIYSHTRHSQFGICTHIVNDRCCPSSD
jgi:hypothetical protein